VTFLQMTKVTEVTFPKRGETLISFHEVLFAVQTPLFSGIVIMRMRYVLILFFLLSTILGPAGKAQGQQAASSSSGETTRRIVRQTAPVYPEMARKTGLGGTVKVVAVIAADGGVKSVEPVGGSPVLIKAAQDAIVKWKFAPGVESRQTVELHFNP
jgi:TonB family protein